DIYSAERSRKSNNAQIMTMGAQIVGPELAKKLVEVWLSSEFEGGRSSAKVRKIMEIEKENFS
ncbi:MAG: RpiB/LacA/LacB family sugar-phosphate isomerase, partial [bacterium]